MSCTFRIEHNGYAGHHLIITFGRSSLTMFNLSSVLKIDPGLNDLLAGKKITLNIWNGNTSFQLDSCQLNVNYSYDLDESAGSIEIDHYYDFSIDDQSALRAIIELYTTMTGDGSEDIAIAYRNASAALSSIHAAATASNASNAGLDQTHAIYTRDIAAFNASILV